MTAESAVAILMALAAVITASASLVASYRHTGQIAALHIASNSMQSENARLNLALGTAQGAAAQAATDKPQA